MGNPQLNFFGFSYGSELSQTYASITPDASGRIPGLPQRAGNYCIDAAVTDYLTTRPPAEGSACQPAGSPFGPFAARDGTPGANAAIAATFPTAVRARSDK